MVSCSREETSRLEEKDGKKMLHLWESGPVWPQREPCKEQNAQDVATEPAEGKDNARRQTSEGLRLHSLFEIQEAPKGLKVFFSQHNLEGSYEAALSAFMSSLFKRDLGKDISMKSHGRCASVESRS